MNRELVRLIRGLARPLTPQPTGLLPSGSLRLPVQAVLFDVYGTLFVSRAGGDPARRERFGRRALRLQSGSGELYTRYQERVAEEHRRLRLRGNPHPEIRVERLWREVLGLRSLAAARRFAVEYELRADPVWPMPGINETLTGLRRLGVQMGVLSNAQFMTPLLFPALCGASLRKLGFLPKLTFFSYLEGFAKPSPRIFHRVRDALALQGIRAGQALYIGNDLITDLEPAHAVGMQTALFAGDRRSLRPPKPEIHSGIPSAVLTALPQLLGHLHATPPAHP